VGSSPTKVIFFSIHAYIFSFLSFPILILSLLLLTYDAYNGGEFGQTAIDVENTFLTLNAYETNTPSTVTSYTSSPQYGYNYSPSQHCHLLIKFEKFFILK
jgi:hypothetical protein